MSREFFVLGAGMVGICTAIHLQKKGHQVIVIDQSPPGSETSYGNAGIIQSEAVEPYAFPRNMNSLLNVMFKRDTAVNYHLDALPSLAVPLLQYWKNSEPKKHASISQDYAALISCALQEHQRLIQEAAAEDLIIKKGWLQAFRTEAVWQQNIQNAKVRYERYGVKSHVVDAQALTALEPHLNEQHGLVGAIHWTQPWSVIEPGELVQRYADLFLRLGGEIVQDKILNISQASNHVWQIKTLKQIFSTSDIVIALGPWSSKFITSLGYDNPILIKRGYHQHYQGGAQLNRPLLDAEYGYMLAPMKRGTRLTTGAEFARQQARSTPIQLMQTQQLARDWLDLGREIDQPEWLGYRPCSVDMKPFIGAAPRHRGLWFNFGHGHQGFTLGAASGRLLSEIMENPNTLSPNAHRFTPERNWY